MTPSNSTTALAAIIHHPGDFPPRVRGFIQNVSANALYVKFGPGATTTDYDFVLNGAADGEVAGGDAEWGHYAGIVTIAGTSPSYVAEYRTV